MGPICSNTEQWCKIWINLDLVVSKLAWGIGWTFIKALKNLEICTLMGSFFPRRNASVSSKITPLYFLMQNLNKPWKFQLEISEELCVMTLKSDAKCKGKLTRGLKNDKEFNLFSCEQLKVWKLAFDGFLLLKAYKVLDEKVQKSYLSWQWKVMQSLKKNWLLVSKMTWQIW